MGTTLAIAGLLAAIVGPIAALAYRHDEKWPAVRDRIYWSGVAALGVAGVLGTGLWTALLFRGLADQAIEIGTATAAICTSLMGLLIVTWVADWLREP